jgi:hypothetical protein
MVRWLPAPDNVGFNTDPTNFVLPWDDDDVAFVAKIRTPPSFSLDTPSCGPSCYSLKLGLNQSPNVTYSSPKCAAPLQCRFFYAQLRFRTAQGVKAKFTIRYPINPGCCTLPFCS